MFAMKSEVIDKCDALVNIAAEIHIPSHSMSSSRAQLRIAVKGKRHSAVPPAQSWKTWKKWWDMVRYSLFVQQVLFSDIGMLQYHLMNSGSLKALPGHSMLSQFDLAKTSSALQNACHECAWLLGYLTVYVKSLSSHTESSNVNDDDNDSDMQCII